MYYRLIKEDIAKSKVITLIMTMFVAVAAMLVSLSAILLITVTSSIDTLMEEAKTPHFMQMHQGEINQERLKKFVEQNSEIALHQVQEFVNIDESQFKVNGKPFVGTGQDNGFSTQSEQFDYLLDLTGQVIQVNAGEVYVPVNYSQNNAIQIGDNIQIGDTTLLVAGFLRDSQMNSLLASSKRFLVAEQEFNSLKKYGTSEQLIEFRLHDLAQLGAFESVYATAGLEANGPTLTYPLFKLLNAISDGLVITVLIFVSLLVVLIAFMCIRFTLLARIAADYREIGVMKAIGLRVTDIKKIYLAKYVTMIALGSFIGLVGSLAFKGKLLANSQLFMGHMTSQTPIFLVGALGILMVFLINSLYVNHLLNRFRKLSAVDALRFGQVPVRFKKRQRVYVTQSSVVPTTVYLGIKDIFAQKRLYVTLLFVMIMALFMMIVPQNLKHTIASKEFVTYMGIGDSDIRIDLQQINDIPDRATKISQSLAQDSRVNKQTVLTTKMLKTKGSNGSDERLKVELGNHQVFPLTYAEGKAPQKEHEIALSVISAEELGKKVGDTLTLVVDNQAREMVVCGTYSDITNGGKTAKAAFTTSSDDTMWSVIYVNLVDKELIEELTIDYTQQFPFAKTTSINKFIQQTFQSTIHSVNRAAYIGGMIAILITLLVTTLFTRLLISQETPTIGALKALGFTTTDIIKQYLTRTVCIAIIALVSGVVLANILGERLIGLVIGSFGASAFDLSIQPVMTYLIGPLIILCSVVIATLLGTLSIKQIKICESMRE